MVIYTVLCSKLALNKPQIDIYVMCKKGSAVKIYISIRFSLEKKHTPLKLKSTDYELEYPDNKIKGQLRCQGKQIMKLILSFSNESRVWDLLCSSLLNPNQ